METVTETIYSYKAIDGSIFSSEKECREYENSLPGHLVFCLQNKYTAKQLREIATFELGYTSSWATSEYESPGFLRQGGEYTVHHSSDTVLEIVMGELSDVVTYALKNREWARHYNKFIRKTSITDLTS